MRDSVTQLARYLRWAVGTIFLLGGVAKVLPWPEDPYATLAAGNAANRASWFAPLSGFAAAHAAVLVPAIGLAMALSGLGQLTCRRVRAACLTQLAMMAGFVLLLHRAFPAVLAVDGVLAATVVVVLWRDAA